MKQVACWWRSRSVWHRRADVAAGGAGSSGRRFWPQWRGPYATGVSKHANPPLEWSETKNVRWKVEIPGRGSSSPVVWGDRIFLLTAVPVGVDGRGRARAARRASSRATSTASWCWRSIGAPARSSGSARPARARPHEASHQDNGTWASSSAITDGQHVFAWFESQGMFAYDMDGTLLWQKDLGDKQMRKQFGEGSTPVLYGNRIVIVWDHQGQSFVVALDALTGNEIWRVRARRDRHAGRRRWSSSTTAARRSSPTG